MLKPQIKTTIAELGGLTPAQLGDEQYLADLLVDSFAIIDLSIALQESLGIIFTQDDFRQLETVAELVALVESKLRQKKSA